MKSLPSHRILAMYRGETQGVLSLTVDPEPHPRDPADPSPTDGERRIAARFRIADRGRPADRWLLDTVNWAWRTRILVSLGIDVRTRLRQSAERDAAAVFAANLKDLLLAAPAGSRATLGLDPGFRTGVKVAVVDGTGKVVAHDTIYPHQPVNKWEQSLATLQRLVTAHQVELVAIGNGTASRETDRLATDLAARCPGLTKVVVSEAGASVYSASAYASGELPDLDVSIRGAVSIARRLQDPLAELVKIDPKSIGVGQYQHDVAEAVLARSVDAVVEDCVNAVGVEVNTASVPLLSRVSGISGTLAENIVLHRDTNGPFRTRRELKSVARLGAKAYEQCAGFLRIADGDDPLDSSSVHPEAYSVVRKILATTGGRVGDLIGNTAVLRALQPAAFVDDTFGLPTVTDILAELEKPGRDPRPAFATAAFADGVEKVADLRVGMVLEGVVTNVAAFGAFVDVGVHQDGLVHVSAMSRKFVGDPREVVTSGQVVKVKVMEVDEARKRISLTLRLDDEPGRAGRPAPSHGPLQPEPVGLPGVIERGLPRVPGQRSPPRPADTCRRGHGRCAAQGRPGKVARRQDRRALCCLPRLGQAIYRATPCWTAALRSLSTSRWTTSSKASPAMGDSGSRNSAVVVSVARSVAAPLPPDGCALPTDPAHGTAYQELIHFRPAVQAAATSRLRASSRCQSSQKSATTGVGRSGWDGVPVRVVVVPDIIDSTIEIPSICCYLAGGYRTAVVGPRSARLQRRPFSTAANRALSPECPVCAL